METHRNELTALLGELVSVRSVMDKPSENAPFGKEAARALELTLKKCGEYGLITENTDNYAGSADITSQTPGLAVLCHLDVVPENDGWNSDPFTLFYDKNTDRIYGRGTSDDKGPAAAAVFAARAVKELGIPLKKGVRLIFGTNEENGSADLKYYMKRHKMPPMVFTPDGSYPVINIEKGMIRLNIRSSFPDDGQIRFIRGGGIINAVPGKAEAEICGISAETAEQHITSELRGAEFSFTENNGILHIGVCGTSAHASSPEKGVNALTALLSLISRLPLKDSPRFNAVRALAELYPYGETDGNSCGIACADEKSGKLTIVLSVLELNNSGFSAKNDIRFPVSSSCEEVLGKITYVLANRSFTAEPIMCDEPHCTDESSEFVQTLLRVYENVTGDKGECIAIGGGTYVHHIDGGVAFGAEFPGEDVNMHGADEFITVENLLKNAVIMAHAMIELCSEV